MLNYISKTVDGVTTVIKYTGNGRPFEIDGLRYWILESGVEGYPQIAIDDRDLIDSVARKLFYGFGPRTTDMIKSWAFSDYRKSIDLEVFIRKMYGVDNWFWRLIWRFNIIRFYFYTQ